MHHFEWYVLVAVNYFIGPMFFAFIVMLTILRIMKIVSPARYNKIIFKVRRLSRLSRWEKNGNFEKVIAHYKKQAEKKKQYRNFYLGLSNLYKYNWKEAHNYLEKYLKYAVGNRQILRAKNYLGTALLQGKNYQQAARIYEECRQQGNVFIIPNVLSLVLTRQYTKAQEFYEIYPAPDWAHHVMQKLLAFDKNDPSSLIIIKETIEKLDPRFYLYKSTFEDIVERYELELFFHSPTSLQTLQEEVVMLCSEISHHPSFFESAQLQWIRKLLNEYISKIPTKQIIWLEGIDPIIESFNIRQLHLTFAKLHWLYQNSVHNIGKGEYERFFSAALPSSAKEVIRYDQFIKYELYEDKKTQLGFEMHVDSEHRRVLLKVIPWQEVKDIKRLTDPLLANLASVPSNLQQSFHRVLFDLFFNRHYTDHLKRTVIPFIEKLPFEHQSYFETIKNHYNK